MTHIPTGTDPTQQLMCHGLRTNYLMVVGWDDNLLMVVGKSYLMVVGWGDKQLLVGRVSAQCGCRKEG